MSIFKTHGVVPTEDQLKMSGLEFVEGLASGALPLNSMARTLKYDIVQATKGCVVVTAAASHEHLNPSGTVHGGLAATLRDTCMGLAVRTMVARGKMSTTIELRSHSSDRSRPHDLGLAYGPHQLPRCTAESTLGLARLSMRCHRLPLASAGSL